MFATAVNMICCNGVAFVGGGGSCARAGVTSDACSAVRAATGPIVLYHFMNTYRSPIIVLTRRIQAAAGGVMTIDSVTQPEQSPRRVQKRNRRICVVDLAGSNKWASASGRSGLHRRT